MEGLRRAHDRHVEEERAAEKDKEKQRKARADAERKQREQAKAERAKAGSSSTPRSSRTLAPWPQGLPITGVVDAAAKARHEAVKSASLEQAAEYAARLLKQEGDRVQEALRKIEALRQAEQIQRGD
jgi:hypothetical protein